MIIICHLQLWSKHFSFGQLFHFYYWNQTYSYISSEFYFPLFFSCTILPDHRFPLFPIPVPTHLPFPPRFSSISFQKSRPPRDITDQSILKWDKTKVKPLYQGWTGQWSKRKRVPLANKSIRDFTTHNEQQLHW